MHNQRRTTTVSVYCEAMSLCLGFRSCIFKLTNTMESRFLNNLNYIKISVVSSNGANSNFA